MGDTMRDFRSYAALAALLALPLAAFALSGCNGASSAGTTTAAPPEATTGQPATPPAPAGEKLHTSTVKVTGTETWVITTDRGVIEIAFYADKAPNTVASMIELTDKGYFDGIKFHRVEPGFVVQGGDPLSKTDDPNVGTGGPGWALKAEFNDIKHVEGTVAMARTNAPDSAGSQFYIALAPLPQLDGQYTVFGHVTKGMDVVKQIQVGDVMRSVTVRRAQ
jgi:cyclophilin family peptidyl-prolyl cis-trans isomerase